MQIMDICRFSEMAATALLILCFHTKGCGNSFSLLLSAVRYSAKFANLSSLSKHSLLSFPVSEIALGNSIKHANLNKGNATNQLWHLRHLTTWLLSKVHIVFLKDIAAMLS